MKRGFTLIELMIVVAILCIIAAVCVPLLDKKESDGVNQFGMLEDKSKHIEAIDYQNAAGQSIAFLDGCDSLGPWLASHHDCEIISLVSVSTSSNQCNPTNGFIIVYRVFSRGFAPK